MEAPPRPLFHVLDLFSGIGGFSLGLERTGGFVTTAFCEIDPFCRRVLAKHWPGIPIYDDVRALTAARLAADAIRVDVLCGGFPCQDISVAGLGAGLDGERSGLWVEFARLISELRPRYVIVENVAALLALGLDRVLGDLAKIGFDAEWHGIPASAVGARHLRDRVWVVAYPSGVLGNGRDDHGEGGAEGSRAVSELGNRGCAPLLRSIRSGRWPCEPGLGRVAHGVPDRVDRLRGLGNAVVPQIPELIGWAILAAERESLAA